MAARILAPAAALLAAIALTFAELPEASAQQINPTASSVQEDALLDALQSGEALSGRVTIPDERAANLIKPGNKGWASLSQGSIQTLQVVLFLGTLVLLAAFFMFRGRIRIEGGPSGRTIQRFNAIERFAHWTLAGSFIVLALTGLNIVVGRAVILPLIGEGAFGTLTAWGKIAHNFLAWPFMIALALVFLLWIVHNLPGRGDLTWIRQGGGLLRDGEHPPARKFNAGQKLVFWSVVLGGAALSFTGVMLLFPPLAGTSADWQLYQVIHGVVAALLTAVILGHIYIGTIGMEGAYKAMRTGKVDEAWAKEHHEYWYDDIKSGKIPATRSGPREAGDASPAGERQPA